MNFDLYTLAIRAIVLILTIPVHEFAHAYAAYKLGDSTAKYQGRLTLDPMQHFDLVGSLSLIFLGIGWARPVPVNPNNFKNRKQGMAISAAAGPLSNFALAFISIIVYKILLFSFGYASGNTIVNIALDISWYMMSINISLGIFNLMPFPPFDGSRIFGYFMSDRMYFKIMEYERQIFFIVFAGLWLGIFDGPLRFFNGLIFNGLDSLTFFIDMIF